MRKEFILSIFLAVFLGISAFISLGSTWSSRGYFAETYTATFVNVTGTATAPTTFTDPKGTTVTEIDSRDSMSDIIIQMVRDTGNHTATDWDLNILGSESSGGTYNNYQSFDANADSDPDIKLLSSGPNFIKPTLDENASLRGDITLYITVKK